jgi:uncharacterized GH25 family protein
MARQASVLGAARARVSVQAIVLALAASALLGPAQAHTSYLMPSTYSTASDDVVTIEASFAETMFFRPEIAVGAQDFHLYRPDGRRDYFDRIESFRQATILESDLAERGTYRFTTGERLGRISTLYRIDGEWRGLEPGAPAPAGAEAMRSQTATVADVYVTKGAPTDAALRVAVGRLAITPITHPSAIYLEDGFAFEVTFDGALLPNQEIEIDREGGGYEEPKFHRLVRTDAAGRVTLSFDRPGAYLVMTRHRATAPAGAETPMRSYTTSLTFEVSR